ncbi:MAG: ATP-binding protein [Mesorhizobium sp.]
MLDAVRAPWRDFLAIHTLARRAGCSVGTLAIAAVKEVIDNALDASPQGIEVTIGDRTVTVRDFGPGLAETKILELFSVRRDALSSKRWRQARRGALGNGLRVVMGAMHCSGAGGDLTVESRGAGLALGTMADGSTRVIGRFDSDVGEGTSVSLTIGQDLEFDRDRIETYAALSKAAMGVAFGGSKAVPQWFDRATIIELARDVETSTSVMEFARQFDLTAEAMAAIKMAAARTTTSQLLDSGLFGDSTRLDDVVDLILKGGKEPPRELKRMGRAARGGAYSFFEGLCELGDAQMPVLIEVWTEGCPVRDRRTSGSVVVDTIFVNRTPALILRRASGLVEVPGFNFRLGVENTCIEVPAQMSGLKGPCSFAIDIAITAAELPLISEGKAVDLSVFAEAIGDTIAPTLKRAYVPPLMTLAETAEPTLPRPPREPKSIQEPKPDPPPHILGSLGNIHHRLVLESGRASEDLIVLSDGYDPYALDTRQNRAKAEWLRAAMAEAGVAGRVLHVRGLFYALVAHGRIFRHDGRPFVNTLSNWMYLQAVCRVARWLGTVAWTQIIDERNTPPVIRLTNDDPFDLKPIVGVKAGRLWIPSDSGTLTIQVDEERGFPRHRQPFNLALLGEKTGLEPVLGPIAEKFGASLYLPSGEPSLTMMEGMARFGAADGRPLMLFTFTDFDPTGNNIPATVARRLQAFRDLCHPCLEFEVRPVALAEEQVRSLNLPSTPLKETEARAPEWLDRYGGLEQTEIDALSTLRPEILTEIAETAIAPFFDASLAERQQAAEQAWSERAQAVLDDLERSRLSPIERRMRKQSRKIGPLAVRFNAAAAAWERAAATLIEEVEFETFEPAEGESASEEMPPLVSSAMDPLTFIDALRARMIRRPARRKAVGEEGTEADDDD